MQTSEKHDKPIKLSLIELGAVNQGRNRSESIKDIIETAQKIEEWGFSRCLELLADVFQLAP